MKVGIVYTSRSGNTEEAAEWIATFMRRKGIEVVVKNVYKGDMEWVEDVDHLFLGSYTWSRGSLPKTMRSFLRKHIKEEKKNWPAVSVFGTGDMGFPDFCLAVEEMAYHVSKVTEVHDMWKWEQAPRKNDIPKIESYVNKFLERELKYEWGEFEKAN